MKRKQIVLLFGLLIAIPTVGQVKIDTLYYDKEWKGVESNIFASYMRVMEVTDDHYFRKRFRDYYITGELRSEGEYLTIDRYDDSKSVFMGEWVSYYPSGKVAEKANRINGKRDGEYVKYREDGFVLLHAYFKEDRLHGVYTEFSEEDNVCMQREYRYGEPLYDYCVMSNQDGFCSKVRMSDKRPIYESPELDERAVEYKDGETWSYYNKNGIKIGMTNNKVSAYGKYFQVPIIITNHSMFPIHFDPQEASAVLMNKKGEKRFLKIYSAEEYIKKVRDAQMGEKILVGVMENLAANNAGYSTSTTKTSYSSHSSNYGATSAVGNKGYAYTSKSSRSSFYGHSTSTTTTHDGIAAYQARIIASNRIAAYNEALLAERNAKEEGYLKRTTIHPGETVTGYIYIERKKGVSMTIYVDINGVNYIFPWDVSE